MSLEQALAENTAALDTLIALLQKTGGVPSGLAAPQGAVANADLKVEPKVEKLKAEEPKVEKAKTAEPTALAYATDLRAPFLALVASNEKAALGILAKLGVKSLKEIEGQADKYPEVKALIDSAAKEA